MTGNRVPVVYYCLTWTPKCVLEDVPGCSGGGGGAGFVLPVALHLLMMAQALYVQKFLLPPKAVTFRLFCLLVEESTL